MTNLTKEEYARLHLKAKRGMLTAEERAALEAYEAAEGVKFSVSMGKILL